MSYFRELPNVEYENFLDDSTGSQSYILMKNIFVRGKLRDDLQNVFTIFNKYIISGDERPDQIAEKLYGTTDLDWVILTVANIINYQNEYPLSSQQLYDYTNKKYGPENINKVNYYQTREVKDSLNRLILPAGLQVNKEFTIPDPNNPLAVINPTVGVSNFEYESSKNDAKREIYVLKPEYIGQFLNDMEDISTYGFNSEFVNEKTIRTENTRNLNP